MSATRSIAVFLLCMHLALPKGWCCYLDQVASWLPLQKASAPVSCCCADMKAEPAPADSEQAPPSEKPNPRFCCCDNLISLAKVSQDNVDSELPLSLDTVATEALSLVSKPVEPAYRFAPDDPPLHILQCVWLC